MTTNYQIQDYDAPYEHHPVDDIEPVEVDENKLASALLRVILWAKYGVTNRSIAARVYVLSECLGINEHSMTWAEIAKITGLERAAIQLMAKEVEDKFNLRSANARNNETREKCKLAQTSKKK